MTLEKYTRLPVVTWENLRPPFTDYDYFVGAQRFPFDHHATGLSLVNAWWLAETAALVYADEAYVRLNLERAGFDTIKHFYGQSTDCFVASNAKVALVAFRGTELRPREKSRDVRPVWADIVTDVDLRLIPSGRSGRVHSGFQTALDEIWEELVEYMQTLHHGGLPVWITGHSLGAALATLTVHRFEPARALYSFGSPRVGDREFVQSFAAEAYRFVNGSDIITRLPPAGDYHHVGVRHTLDPSDRGNDRDSGRSGSTARLQFDLARFGRLIGQVGAEISKMVPESIRDHVPILYAAKLRRRLLHR